MAGEPHWIEVTDHCDCDNIWWNMMTYDYKSYENLVKAKKKNNKSVLYWCHNLAGLF